MDKLTDVDVFQRYTPLLYRLVKNSYDAKIPLLAHYTSISALEHILRSSQIWFSNPLFMNDLQELKFGMNEGRRIVLNGDNLERAGRSQHKSQALKESFLQYFRSFEEDQAFDIYIFCLSEHDRDDSDGRLSMWRGYGSQGNGAAIVFDPSKVTLVPTSPLLIERVRYLSDSQRSTQLSELVSNWVDITATLELSEMQVHIASYAIFNVIRFAALSTKHVGFSEEKEWRIIYMPDRDVTGALKKYFGYEVRDTGVQPKLKYEVGHIDGVSAPDLALDRLVDRIILGPSASSPLAQKSVERMFDGINRSSLKDRLRASTIPLRPISGTSF